MLAMVSRVIGRNTVVVQFSHVFFVGFLDLSLQFTSEFPAIIFKFENYTGSSDDYARPENAHRETGFRRIFRTSIFKP
jgi:hypothetical protein